MEKNNDENLALLLWKDFLAGPAESNYIRLLFSEKGSCGRRKFELKCHMKWVQAKRECELGMEIEGAGINIVQQGGCIAQLFVRFC